MVVLNNPTEKMACGEVTTLPADVIGMEKRFDIVAVVLPSCFAFFRDISRPESNYRNQQQSDPFSR